MDNQAQRKRYENVPFQRTPYFEYNVLDLAYEYARPASMVAQASRHYPDLHISYRLRPRNSMVALDYEGSVAVADGFQLVVVDKHHIDLVVREEFGIESIDQCSTGRSGYRPFYRPIKSAW